MLKDFHFADNLLSHRADDPRRALISHLPAFFDLLAKALRLQVDEKNKAGERSMVLFHFWTIDWQVGPGKNHLSVLQCSCTPRSRKLSEKVRKYGPQSEQAQDYFHKVLTQGDDFMALISLMLRLHKQGKYPAALGVGTNLFYLFKCMTDLLLLEVFEHQLVVSLPEFGVFWRGLRHRHTVLPEYDPGGHLQFLPSFIEK